MDSSNSENFIYEDFFLILDQALVTQPATSIRPLNPLLDSHELPYKRSSSLSSCGYPLDLFISPPPSKFICKICLKVVKKPLECKKCGSLFCSSCTSHGPIVTQSSKFDCTACNTQTIAKDPSPLLLRIISEQSIKCKHAGLGCNYVIELGNMTKHENLCPFRKVLCQNYQNCKNQGYIKDFREFNTLSRAHFRLRNQSVKVYACSLECFKLVSFKGMAEGKQVVEALKEYFDILKETEEKI